MTTATANSGERQPVINEKLLLMVMAAIQFTTILDFLIIIPLEPQYMKIFNISVAQSSIIVSAYAIAAGISGVAAGFWLDRFDRKSALMFLYLGFTLGTLFCAVAPTYHLLVAARIVAGTFGGVAGALILAIVGDAVPEERRGRAMGVVMSSFSLASICGVPLGLLLAADFNWRVPFFILSGLCLVILIAAAMAMPSMRGHMHHSRDKHPVAQVMAVLMHPDHQMAFLFMALLTMHGFLIFPTMPIYMETNVGLTDKQLIWVYLVGGLCTFFSMNWVGRWADRAGKCRVFVIMAFTTAIPIMILTTLPRVPVYEAVAVTTVFMICMSGRMVPAMALMTSSVEPRYRGGFMSINSSVQQFCCGVATLITGAIITPAADKRLMNYPIAGIISIVSILGCIYLVRYFKAPAGKELASEPVMMEG